MPVMWCGVERVTGEGGARRRGKKSTQSTEHRAVGTPGKDLDNSITTLAQLLR